VDESGKLVLEPATLTVLVGPCSPGPRGVELGLSQGATGSFELQ
jgi:hypothetical protein